MAPMSEEEENYIRLILLLKGVQPKAVRYFFDKEFPPSCLLSELSANYTTLHGLKRNRVLSQAQWNLLFPSNGVPDSAEFDVSLMICLITNLTTIIPPINGFHNLPLPEETNTGPDLARLNWYRNKLAHHDSNKIEKAYFSTAWNDISAAVSRLGGQQMYQECQYVKMKILDQSNQERTRKIKSLPSLAVPGSLSTNYSKIGYAAHKLFPEILQELIAKKESPQQLSNDFNTNRNLSKNLRGDELLLINNVVKKGYADFDIPLIFKLIRNLKLLPPPTQGWDHSNAPCVAEITPGDDLERIRRLRKEILCRHNSEVTDTESSEFFVQFKGIAGRLETYLEKQTGEFVDMFIDLETCYTEEETRNVHFKRHTRFKKREEDYQKRLRSIEREVNALKEKTDAMKAKSATVKDDIGIHGYKGVNNTVHFFQLDIVCDNFVVDCIVHRKHEEECRMSVKEFQDPDVEKDTETAKTLTTVICLSALIPQDCTEEITQWSETQSDFYEKLQQKILDIVRKRKSCLCLYLLKHTSINAIETHILVNALYASITNGDVDSAKFIGWQIARNFMKLIDVHVYDIWLVSMCSCSRLEKKSLSWFCSKNVAIIIMVPQFIKEIEKNFFGLPIRQILYHCEIFKEAQAISDERTKLVERDLNIHCHVPGSLAEKLFNNHKRLSFVCPADIKSINFKDSPTTPTFYNCSCIQLFCYVKGAIPIGERHFPGELQGIPTDVIEGFPRFSSKTLRIGDSVSNLKVKGTLGGFCLFYGREAFLTCAHAMLDWDTLLSTGHKHHMQPERVHFNTGDKILDPTLLCGKVVNHSFTHYNPREISTDVALVEIDHGLSVSADDYVNTKGNGPLHYSKLGLKSLYLQDGYIRSPQVLPGKNVAVVCASAVSGFKDPVSLISEKPENVLEREDLQSASARTFQNLNTPVNIPVHMQVRVPDIILQSRQEEVHSQRTLRFYNQLAVHNIPFQQGDSGACVYITNGYLETGCLGMAIADCPGGGCIVTPMAKLLEKLGLI